MPTAFLTTKFFIPPAHARRVTRPRLIERLGESLRRKLTLVSAPAGFGKTVLLGDWSRRVESPVAWVTLDDGDNDSMRFWGYVLTALDRVPALEGTAKAALALVQDASAAAVEPALAALINALAEREAAPEVALVLDDYHTLTAPPVHDSLAYLLEHLPPTMHVILASRADPPLPLARLRAHGQLLELRAHDLRFTSAETSAFLNDLLGLNLSPDDVADLETHTEGWVTGLQLAALSMQARGDPHTFIREFSGTNPYILEFLTEEVLSHHPEPVRQFLERSSILEKLCVPLCAAVAEQPRAAELLAHLQRHNLFIEPLDDLGEWYRLHPLLAEALLTQLRRAQPALIPELHRRARDWHVQQGHLHEAMRHALAGGDAVWAAELIEREYRPLLARGELMTLGRWLDALPDNVARERPKINLAQAWALGYSGHYAELERHLRQAEAALATPPTGEAEGDPVRGEILALRAIAGALRGAPPRETIGAAQRALGLVGERDALACAMAHQALGHAYRVQGRPVEAEREYESALAFGPASSRLTMLGALLRKAQVQVMRGQLQIGAQSFRKHLELASAYGGQVRLYAGEALIRLGDLHREWNELDTALAHVQEGLELAQRVENAVALLNGYYTLAHVHAARSEHPLAQAALRQAEQHASRYDFWQSSERAALHRTWLALATGHTDEASRWAESYAAQRVPAPETVSDFQDLLLARIWLRTGRASEAQSLLNEVSEAAEAAGRGWTALQTLVVRALAAQAQGDHQRAFTTLTTALSRAEPEGYVRLFVDEGQPMRALLSEQTQSADRRQGDSNGRRHAYLDRLLAAFGPATSDNQGHIYTSPHGHWVEALSVREREVLRLMASGACNQAIADALVISVGTVKSHINRILGKLGVRNRTEAVVCAQTLHLL
jgi:LuxR family maltose regulon positive regulatory protein